MVVGSPQRFKDHSSAFQKLKIKTGYLILSSELYRNATNIKCHKTNLSNEWEFFIL